MASPARLARHVALAVLFAEAALGAPAVHAQRIDPDIARARVLPERPIGGRVVSMVRRATPVLVELDPERARLSPDPFLELDALPDVEVVSTWGDFALVRVGVVGVSSLAGSRLVRTATDARTSTPRLPPERTRQLPELQAPGGPPSAGSPLPARPLPAQHFAAACRLARPMVGLHRTTLPPAVLAPAASLAAPPSTVDITPLPVLETLKKKYGVRPPLEPDSDY